MGDDSRILGENWNCNYLPVLILSGENNLLALLLLVVKFAITE